ncbi:MAG: AAA family ATPase [Firmicutes bacterium]|nr:AAA family ATPase [Bacillota bacterium]
MYLKEIRAHGFKSFADDIKIELSKGTNGIVGPNGSGKSNIVDAVRWVLGEQSVKSLRGDNSMTDVIFSGSKSRNAAGSASVTLVFDNKDRYLKIDNDTISIKRKLYNDGTNEFYLNNEKCRLKDVVDILLDSGIAKESFNIISQGKIEEILSTKPTDRRIIFEEAAGVLKYKKRKEDALRKLDKTHDNMTRAEDIINELAIQVEPLKRQRDTALKYEEYNEELEKTEIALMTHDITNLNEKLINTKAKIDDISHELTTINNSNLTSTTKITKYKLDLSKLEDEINEKQKELIKLTTNVEKINSQKEIIVERKKYEVDDIKLHDSLIELKEKELKLKNSILKLENELNLYNDKLIEINKNINELEEILKKIKSEKQEVENKLSILIKNNNSLKYKIDSLNDNIENNSLLPLPVKQVLNNHNLKGIHNILGNLIEVENVYSLAISTALGASSSNIVVDNSECAKTAIKYLNDEKIGRVTFLPLDTLKPKEIDIDTKNTLNNEIGFIGIASNLIKYNSLYSNIVSNILGNVIVVDNIDNANRISKIINHRYKIVTLNGEVLHVGGSITGGFNKTSNIITIKYELENYIKEYENKTNEIKTLENLLNEFDYKFKSKEDELYLANKEKIEINTLIENTDTRLIDSKEELTVTTNNISGTNSVLNKTVSIEEEKIINSYYSELSKKEQTQNELNILQDKKNKLNEELEEFEHERLKDNTLYNTKNKELKNLEIELNRYDVKIDMLLNSLNENYSITYEKAKSEYILVDEEDVSRNRVNVLKNKIKDLGPVNLNAPIEYNKVSERYEFLIKQRDDLVNAENILLNIIKELDEVMENDFLKTFNLIKSKFNETFRELFKGGFADLRLCDESNILTTGIEIIASPPGKKLTTISLLSGGEKTFTAISLLFAILKSREVPFCILDEVEAALDEVNVSSFGEYINKLKEKTQFILITHKKKTMEYVDVLYGITMQESGVSKLVSVKLEDIIK